jgi:3-deoxy-7-phosphoheptulonate synthase
MVDCSHANSGKSHVQQEVVCRDVANQIAHGERRIMGLMLESNLIAGRQDKTKGEPLVYGQSITDACMAWDNSEVLLRELAQAVQSRRKHA